MHRTHNQEQQRPRKTAEQHSLALSHSGTYSIGTGGESKVYTAFVNDIKIGKVGWHGVNLEVTWDTDLPYGAIVGANFLFQNDVEFSLRDKEIRFFEPKDCDNAFLGYWDKNAVAIRLDEMAPDDLRPTVEITANGKKLRALIDSGAPLTSIDVAAAARLGVTPQSPGAIAVGAVGGVGTHENDAWTVPLDDITIGDETISHPRILMLNLYGSLYKDEHARWAGEYVEGQPPVILGEDFLRSHRLLVAMSQHTLYFSYVGGVVFGAPAEERGN